MIYFNYRGIGLVVGRDTSNVQAGVRFSHPAQKIENFMKGWSKSVCTLLRENRTDRRYVFLARKTTEVRSTEICL